MTSSSHGSRAAHVISPEDTRAALFATTARRGGPISNEFVQLRRGTRAPGPLHHFVRERRSFALNLYLLLHCVALGDPWDKALPAAVWARSLDNTTASGETAVSRAWRWLSDHQLVVITRENRLANARLLRDDGTGRDYNRPTGYFFVVPNSYFLEGWHEKLTLRGTTALLIALQQTGGSRKWFRLPMEQAPRWFGISADTLQRGLAELHTNRLLDIEQRVETNPLARYGVVSVNYYELRGSLAPPARHPKITLDGLVKL